MYSWAAQNASLHHCMLILLVLENRKWKALDFIGIIIPPSLLTGENLGSHKYYSQTW